MSSLATFVWADVCSRLGLGDRAGEFYELLEPFSSQLAVTDASVWGSIPWALGNLAPPWSATSRPRATSGRRGDRGAVRRAALAAISRSWHNRLHCRFRLDPSASKGAAHAPGSDETRSSVLVLGCGRSPLRAGVPVRRIRAGGTCERDYLGSSGHRASASAAHTARGAFRVRVRRVAGGWGGG